ncbi:LPXTG-motif cell wall-anchored protein [Deinobacterium chartae]|uniref:LPXTG-motif cell wall-anchored protein n=1 Tax=Deinobacterium chartae TaxID=521158 RepID=A0A841HYE5_9DEIO|nr:LPXTG cell wall anchor domain-containing protein [Deinobacterium chartae]MBB6098417.1 LPXTG-motif cell wall-anchored protein [Deinobacterium chartae]
MKHTRTVLTALLLALAPAATGSVSLAQSTDPSIREVNPDAVARNNTSIYNLLGLAGLLGLLGLIPRKRKDR